jgi:hypothetical protein
MELLLSLLVRYLVWFAVPYAFSVVMDSPSHFFFSAAAGCLGFCTTWTICQESWIRSWGGYPCVEADRFIFFLSCLAAAFFLATAHYTWDYSLFPVFSRLNSG